MLGAGGWFGPGSPGGDLNGDGTTDALISDALGSTINVYYGEDGGISDTSTTTTVHFALQFIYYIATTDLTGSQKRSGG
jgi:hypothetical protein